VGWWTWLLVLVSIAALAAASAILLKLRRWWFHRRTPSKSPSLRASAYSDVADRCVARSRELDRTLRHNPRTLASTFYADSVAYAPRPPAIIWHHVSPLKYRGLRFGTVRSHDVGIRRLATVVVTVLLIECEPQTLINNNSVQSYNRRILVIEVFERQCTDTRSLHKIS
jgi:hypothetical protein